MPTTAVFENIILLYVDRIPKHFYLLHNKYFSPHEQTRTSC